MEDGVVISARLKRLAVAVIAKNPALSKHELILMAYGYRLDRKLPNHQADVQETIDYYQNSFQEVFERSLGQIQTKSISLIMRIINKHYNAK